MRPVLLALLLPALACRGGQEPEPARPAQQTAAKGTLSERMHGHFRAIRAIHRALLVDDLAAAQTSARELARMPANTGSKDWDDAAGFVRQQAAELAAAPDANQARARSTQMVTYCADCHMFRAEPPTFRGAPAPSDDGSLEAAMARHQWAADTLWLGIIAPSTDLWRQGLAEMARAPRLVGRGERAREVEILRARLEALARGSSELRGQGDRADRLAEIMDVCAGCHAITRPR